MSKAEIYCNPLEKVAFVISMIWRSAAFLGTGYCNDVLSIGNKVKCQLYRCLVALQNNCLTWSVCTSKRFCFVILVSALSAVLDFEDNDTLKYFLPLDFRDISFELNKVCFQVQMKNIKMFCLELTVDTGNQV